MNQDIAIRVSNLSKSYSIGKQKDTSLRYSLSSMLKTSNSRVEKFWALKDVSFEINKGDVIGIIGNNGAGKSTLLKILSQITKPTEGRIEINGRIASLLEVGTGFHPELTGRENIYLNGTILGMTRKEVKAKFDEIVEFSGIGKFIDTPVKHYSSGMYVRLAFAVAAHLEPEILIIDEVLAVGDASFQKKCLGKMEDIAKQGRTVIFVSHDIGAVSSLCNKGILLVGGQVSMTGTASEVAEVYLNKHTNFNFQKEWEINSQVGAIISHSIKLINEDLTECKIIKITSKIGIQLTYEIKIDGLIVKPNIHFKKASGEYVFVTMDHTADDMKSIGKYVSTVWIPNDFLNEGMYTIGIAYTTLEPLILHFQDYNAINIEVVDDLQSVTRCGYNGSFLGVVRPLLEWKTINFEKI